MGMYCEQKILVPENSKTIKVLRFSPPQKYGVAPCLDVQKILAHVVAGVMLFPERHDEKNLRSYLSLGIDAVFSAALKNGMLPHEAVASLLEVVSLFFACPGQKDMPDTRRYAAAWKHYQRALREARFPSKGKGSIAERFMRGQLAGLLVNIVLLSDLSLTKAADAVEAKWPEFKNSLPEWMLDSAPTMTAANLMQNVWPAFRTVGHFWAALQDFDLREVFMEEGSTLLDLPVMHELAAIMLPAADGKDRKHVSIAAWPSRYTGIMALLFKANHILTESNKRGSLKQSSKPLLPPNECWQIVLPG
ncbi:MAG: hypothetical protein FWH34_07125 [Desulfovibrionaceae bacterium]|nr:hypothetical protein [Desulfovibrionaceae bacterium]